MTKRIAATLAALGIALISLFTAPPQPAQAATLASPAGYFTLWDSTAYRDAAYPIPVSWTGCRNVPSWFNDHAESMSNNTTRGVDLFIDGACVGFVYRLYAGTQDSDLSDAQGRNKITSYRFF